MRLTKQTSDSIKILVLCAQTETGLLKTADIADRIGTTRQVGLKLVNLLARQGYVETVRGPSGGIRLGAGVEEHSIGEIVRSLEALELSQADAGASSHRTHRQLESFVDDAFEAFLSVLDGKTIKEMAGGRRAVATGGARTTAKTSKGCPAPRPAARVSTLQRPG
ncbi:MAG: Rrf2 family transcriptional regulator [Pseudomonadota bacterium]